MLPPQHQGESVYLGLQQAAGGLQPSNQMPQHIHNQGGVAYFSTREKEDTNMQNSEWIPQTIKQKLEESIQRLITEFARNLEGYCSVPGNGMNWCKKEDFLFKGDCNHIHGYKFM